MRKFCLITKPVLSISLLVLFIISSGLLRAQNLYDINSIQRIEIGFSQPNWDYQMDTSKYGADGYILADWVVINGQQFDSVGVKYKGNSSYDSTYLKNPMHISLDEFRDLSYDGYSEIKLGNGYADPSMIREALAYSILQDYMDCPMSNYAEVFINGNYIGLFSNDENIGRKFCSDHFYSSQNTFVKCNPQITSAAFKSNLKYINADSSSYQIRYEMQSETGWNDLVALCDSLTNNPSSFGSVMDADRVIWMLAFNNVLVNLDSYSGAFAQNHYVYKDQTGHYNPVVWDLNMAFGGFPFAGSQGVGMGTLDTTGMQTLPPGLHAAETDWPLIYNVMNNNRYRKMYFAHMRTLVNEVFASGSYLAKAAQLQALIDTVVLNDPNNFFTYTEFQNGLTNDVLVGSHYVPGISNLMSARVAYLQSTPEFNYVQPVITNVAVSDTSPAYLGTLSVTAHVSNAGSGSVYLGVRHAKAEKFTRILMMDDGLNNDGAAGDSVYGAAITMSSAQAQYYLYAENDDAGVFSPPRAEHEFYQVNAAIQTAQPGEVVINEFLAVNQNDTVDENGAHEDWIELFNATPNPLNLFGLYLTDTETNLSKFYFPENSIIQPNGYFMIWADEDNTTTGELHCNFKISSGGESLILSNAAGNIIDSISFGTQVPDHSMARCPNATGPFSVVNSPTFKEANHCTDGIDEYAAERRFQVYPNPASDRVEIMDIHKGTTSDPVQSIDFFNSLGEKILSFVAGNDGLQDGWQIDVSRLPAGLFFVEINTAKVKAMAKMIIAR